MSDIGVSVNYEGTQQGQQQLDALLDRLGDLLTAEERAAISSQHFERAIADQAEEARRLRQQLAETEGAQQTFGDSAQGMAQRVNVVEGKVEAFGSALGTLGSTMGGISPELAHVGEGFSTLGDSIGIATSMPGPLGLALAGLNGILGATAIATDIATEHAESLAAAQRDAARGTRDLVAALQQQQQVQAIMSGDASSAAIGDAVREAASVRDAISQELDRARTELERRLSLRGEGGTFAEMQAAEAAVHRQREAIDDLVGSLANAERGYQELVDRQTQATQRELVGDRLDREPVGDPDPPTRRRRSGPSAADRRASVNQTLGADLSAEIEGLDFLDQAYEEYDEHRRELAERRAEEEKAKVEEVRRAEEEAEQARRQALEDEIDARKEGAEELRRIEEAANEERLQQAREITDRVGDTLTQVASAYIDAFGEAIEGQKTLEQAALDATKALLKSIGEEMVAIGIKETLEGFANIVANPGVAATKIPMGIALVAAGAGLGAAGAAIPSQPSAPPEEPRSRDEGDSGGGMMIVINNNQPIVSTGTHAQLSRQMQRQIRDGAEIPTRTRS